MQYLISVIDDKVNPGPPSDMPAIGAFNRRLQAQGYWVYANGLAGPAHDHPHAAGGKRPDLPRGSLRGGKVFPLCFRGDRASHRGRGTHAPRGGAQVLKREGGGAPFPPAVKPSGQLSVIDIQQAIT